MNPFLSVDERSERFPRRVFALVDQMDADVVYLDAVDADWLRSGEFRKENIKDWIEVSEFAPVAILKIRRSAIEIIAAVAAEQEQREAEDEVRVIEHREFRDDRMPLFDTQPSQWMEIEVAREVRGGDGFVYSNLFSEGMPASILAARRLTADEAEGLDQIFDLTPFITDEETIRRDLSGWADGVEWVGVYDVGQGSANGLCDNQGMPKLYFDLGGGVMQNTNTFSPTFTNICLTHGPPIVLSHWDWDHWSSGARFPASARMTWLVPAQRLGAVHATMVAAIVKHGNLLVWPTGLKRVQFGQVRIEKCLGTSGRNDTGLAMFVDGPDGEPPICLTGDAKYTMIPSGLHNCLSVVVPHHGADMKSHRAPSGPTHPCSRTAFSYGQGNSYQHPRPVTYIDHNANNWPQRYCQGVGTDRHTADLRPSLGHVGLTWSVQPLPLQGCSGGLCSLQLIQS